VYNEGEPEPTPADEELAALEEPTRAGEAENSAESLGRQDQEDEKESWFQRLFSGSDEAREVKFKVCEDPDQHPALVQHKLFKNGPLAPALQLLDLR
jgi:hypothetical protein